MMTLNLPLWFWLVLGLVPYRITWRNLPGRVRTLEIQALFWTLTLRLRPSGRHDCKLRIPLIERLRQAVWAAVAHLQNGGDDSSTDD